MVSLIPKCPVKKILTGIKFASSQSTELSRGFLTENALPVLSGFSVLIVTSSAVFGHL